MDRTGTVEKKREQRMKLAGKFEEKVETYSSLVMSFIYMYIFLYNIFLYNITNITNTVSIIHFILFQTEKHNEITNKISRLNNRIKEAQEKSTKAGESSEDSLDAFMSNLNTSTLSKSDIMKMKVELQNLRKEEMQLVKLINLTKPANLPPLVSQVQTEEKKNDSQQKSKNLSMKKISQLEKRRKLFEANVSY